MSRPLRLAVRGLVMRDDRLLMVNAWRDGSDLLCAPGGGVEKHQSLPDNLRREIHEEVGITVTVGPPVLVNEFHDEPRGFHQVDIYFRCTLTSDVPETWTDPEGVVKERHWLTRDELMRHSFKPDSLPDVAWNGTTLEAAYDALEPVLR